MQYRGSFGSKAQSPSITESSNGIDVIGAAFETPIFPTLKLNFFHYKNDQNDNNRDIRQITFE